MKLASTAPIIRKAIVAATDAKKTVDISAFNENRSQKYWLE
jgi:hypothetical protein